MKEYLENMIKELEETYLDSNEYYKEKISFTLDYLYNALEYLNNLENNKTL